MHPTPTVAPSFLEATITDLQTQTGRGSGSLPADQRRSHILEAVRSAGEVDVRRLAADLGVSQMTVRRDLSHLDRVGLLRRVHGGATVRASPTARSEVMPAEKTGIAQAVAGLVQDGDVVGIDVGSTCTAVAHQLALREGLTAVTTSLHAALAFQTSPSRCVLLGGIVTREGSLVDGGPLVHRRELNLTKLVLGCGGVSADRGITYFDLGETAIREDLIERSETVILAADHSKFEVDRAITLGGLGVIDVLVTDAEPPQRLTEALRAAGVEVVVAST